MMSEVAFVSIVECKYGSVLLLVCLVLSENDIILWRCSFTIVELCDKTTQKTQRSCIGGLQIGCCVTIGFDWVSLGYICGYPDCKNCRKWFSFFLFTEKYHIFDLPGYHNFERNQVSPVCLIQTDLDTNEPCQLSIQNNHLLSIN